MIEMEKEKYLLHAMLESYRMRLLRSMSLVQDALKVCSKPYVACSFGKDSLVVLDIVRKCYVGKLDVILVRASEFDEWPGTEELARYYEKEYELNLHEIKTMDITDCFDLAGGFYIFPETEAQRRADYLYEKSFFDGIKKKAREIKADLAFIGLRKLESKKRNYVLNKYGLFFYSKTHCIFQCYPIADWTSRDVWAYIFKNNLRYLELYDIAEDRETARNGTMFASNLPVVGGSYVYRGQLALVKKMYPELYAKFAKKYPEVCLYI